MKNSVKLAGSAAVCALMLAACTGTKPEPAGDSSLDKRLNDSYGWEGPQEAPAEPKEFKAPEVTQPAPAPAPAAATPAPAPAKAAEPAPEKAAEPVPAPAVPEEEGKFEIYTVRAGETLWKIAGDKYQDSRKWELLLDANKELLGDNPDLIRPGMKLKIPVLGK